MTQPKPAQLEMTADEFLAWAFELGTDETAELIGGEVVAMAPERAIHGRIKSELAGQLYNQLIGHPCALYVDSLQVKASGDSVFQPDLLIQCGPVADNATFVTDPAVVIEILSPSTRHIDLLRKVPLYMALPSLNAAILIDPDNRRTLIYRKGGEIGRPDIIEGGAALVEIEMNGGKLAIDLARIFGAAGQ